MKDHLVFTALGGETAQPGKHVLPLSMVVDEKLHSSEYFLGNLVLPSSNMFLPMQTVENMTSRHASDLAPVSLDRQLIPPLDHLVLEPDLEDKEVSSCSPKFRRGNCEPS